MGQIQDQRLKQKGLLQDDSPASASLQQNTVSSHYDLKKHVATIHSTNKLSLVQRKIANALLFNAYGDLLTKSEHQIHISTLCELIGYNSHEQKAIKQALVSLISTVIEWNLVDKDRLDNEGVWNASAIISEASIDGAVCSYSYSNKMRQLLYSPDVYGRLNMQVQAKFKSSYGLALYENCIRYQNINETPWLDIPVFRKLMGVEEGKYAAFKDFRKRVIDIALREVNQHTSYDIDYALKKAGRKVVAIKFMLRKSMANPSLADANQEAVATRLQEEFGFSSQQVTETMANYEESYILEKIGIVQSSPSFQKGKILNLAKYLQGALINDYQAAKGTRPMREAKEKEQQQANSAQRMDENLKRDYDSYLQQQHMDYFQSLPVKEREGCLQAFTETLAGTIYLPILQRDGIENALVKRKLMQFLKTHATLPSMLSLDEYTAKYEVVN